MQTFLPYSDFAESARVLDYRRLGKQRVECKQLCLALANSSYGWQNHPVTKMWRRYEQALALYGLVICNEWVSRGYKDTLTPFFECLLPASKEMIVMPQWIGNEAFHASHRSNLLRKDPIWYGQFNWAEPPDLEYIWPLNCS